MFYRALGLETVGIIGKEFEYGPVAFFDLQSGLKLALWPRKSIADDSGLPLKSAKSTEFTIGHNVNSTAEVDEVMEQARKAGANILNTASDTFWVDYAGYFQNPDGHLREVV